jgi:hypothetical protein
MEDEENGQPLQPSCKEKKWEEREREGERPDTTRDQSKEDA